MYRILLTGSSGAIGTRLFERALKLGYDIKGVDKRGNKWIPSLSRKTIIVDLLKEENLTQLPANFDLIIHFAANARVYELVKNPKLALENIIIAFNILEFARKRGVDKIVFASSRETYGNVMDNVTINEEMVDIRNSESPYSASKISSEALVYAYSKVYGINFVIARFSNVYGMYDDSDRVIPLWIKQTLSNKDLILYGKDKVLDFIYIDDVVDGIIKIIKNFHKVEGNTFNVAYGKGIKLTYLAEKIIALLDGKNKVIIKENRPGEVWRFEADIAKARKLLGYEPKTDIEDGLMRTAQWYKRFYSR